MAPPDGRARPAAVRRRPAPRPLPARGHREDRTAARQRSRVPRPGPRHRTRPAADRRRHRITGYSAADWLREHHRINLHLSDHRRISAQITHADDQHSADRLLKALRDLVAHAEELQPAAKIDIPEPAQLRLEQVQLPRDAFFGRTEQIPPAKAAGRIAAEMLTPYPPGIPAAVPGERLNESVIEYLHSGVQAGMVIPDAADPELESVRVVVEEAAAD